MVPRTEFDRALCAMADVPRYLARDGRRAKMLAALDWRASWEQIKHWRAGRRPAPQWAMDVLAQKARARRAVSDQILVIANQHKPGRGQGWRKPPA